jgi:hypothetical protein
MKILIRGFIPVLLITAAFLTGTARSESEEAEREADMIFLHHSTGGEVWQGGVYDWFERYNESNGTDYRITEQAFPKDHPYGWENYPYDYWNIWVNNAGESEFMEEPTLEMLTKEYGVIVWKHCFPVSDIEEDTGEPNIGSPEKRAENYRIQYEALREKMREFPDTKFIVWTGAAQVRGCTNPEYASRAREFFGWVKSEWDEPGDNIFIWDFHELETEGGLYLLDRYAMSREDSHPNAMFSRKVAPLFCERVVSVIEGRGDSSGITGR